MSDPKLQAARSAEKLSDILTSDAKPEEEASNVVNNMDDRASYSANAVSYVEQAAKEPNFLGDAFYYNLSKTGLYRYLAGDYVVLYRSQLDGSVHSRASNPPVVFPPNEDTMITITTVAPQGNTNRDDNIRRIFDEGYWAAGGFLFHGRQTTLMCDKVSSHPRNRNKHKATVTVLSDRASFNYTGSSQVDKLYRTHMRETGSTISFGIKSMHEKWDGHERRWSYFGFYFLQLELACIHPEKGGVERQMVIAVKIPQGEDVASFMLLHQRILSPQDIDILEKQERSRGLAEFHRFAAERVYRSQPIMEGWVPDNEADIGFISDDTFDPGSLERHLFTKTDPIRELRHILNWLEDLRSEPPPPVNLRRVIVSAHRYALHRLQVMKTELRLREEVATSMEISRGGINRSSQGRMDGCDNVGDLRGDENTNTRPFIARFQ